MVHHTFGLRLGYKARELLSCVASAFRRKFNARRCLPAKAGSHELIYSHTLQPAGGGFSARLKSRETVCGHTANQLRTAC